MKPDFSASAGKPEFAFFVDLDGVLSDFDSHARDNGKYGADGATLWDLLDLSWWKSMPVYAGAADFFENLGKIGPARFLTAPVPQVDCFLGKADWISHFRAGKAEEDLNALIICRAADKNLLARPNHILVDDRQKNIDEWTHAGGIGILHKGDFADTQRRIDEAMAAYKQNMAAAPAEPGAKSAQIFIRSEGALQDSGAKAFFDSARKLGPVRHLADSAAPVEGFGAAAEWTMAFRPESRRFALLDLILCPKTDSSLLARPHHILVDGDAATVAAWTKAGGIGILHEGDYGVTLQKLRDAAAPFPPAPPKPAAYKPK